MNQEAKINKAEKEIRKALKKIARLTSGCGITHISMSICDGSIFYFNLKEPKVMDSLSRDNGKSWHNFVKKEGSDE